MSWLDRLLIGIAPEWGLRRVRARATAKLMARHYDAAQVGRRTSGWHRSGADANVANGTALAALRELSRDLRRNNGWARAGVRVIVNNTVGWGIMPKPDDRSRARGSAAIKIWNAWATSTSADFDGRLNFYGLQRLAMETIVESGEVLIVRQPAATSDGLAIPMRLQVLEPDYLDTSRNGFVAAGGGPIIDGIEFDLQGRRTAYWLFTSHPGGQQLTARGFESVRIPADRVLHIYRVDRPGQVRGVPWLSSAISKLNDFDDFDDAELMQQKVAACFGAFVTDIDSNGGTLGVPGTDTEGHQLEQLEPGHIAYLKPGQTVQFAQPPRAQDSSFSVRALRKVAVSIGVPYEELSGDYSQVNYSSARMARLAHWGNVHEWREHMLIPQFCGGVWKWAMDLTAQLEGWPSVPLANWAPPPMPILEPDKEGLAYQRLLRIGAMTWPQMVRELGEDPVSQLDEIQHYNREFDKRGIVLDTDPRKITVGGQLQSVTGASAGKPTEDGDGEETPDPGSDDADPDIEITTEDSPVTEDKPAANNKTGPVETKPSEVKVFAYHQPFMKAKEIREGIGLPGDVEDGELFANEFVAKHGGKPTGQPASGDGSADA